MTTRMEMVDEGGGNFGGISVPRNIRSLELHSVCGPCGLLLQGMKSIRSEKVDEPDGSPHLSFSEPAESMLSVLGG